MGVAQPNNRGFGGKVLVTAPEAPLDKKTFFYHFNANGDFQKTKSPQVPDIIKGYRTTFSCRASNDESAKKKWRKEWYNKKVLKK